MKLADTGQAGTVKFGMVAENDLLVASLKTKF